MVCYRCGGLMCLITVFTMREVVCSFDQYDCINCGNKIDVIIMVNKKKQLQGIMVHKNKKKLWRKNINENRNTK